MTDGEKREQKALLLLEYQEAEDHLPQLKEKARRKGQSFGVVERWLRYIAGDRQAIEYGEDLSKVGDMIRPNLEKYRENLDLDEIFQLADEVESAKLKVNDLRKRKEQLGLR
jgi:hypothetical protein